jgi:hypothetical protein
MFPNYWFTIKEFLELLEVNATCCHHGNSPHTVSVCSNMSNRRVHLFVAGCRSDLFATVSIFKNKLMGDIVLNLQRK